MYMHMSTEYGHNSMATQDFGGMNTQISGSAGFLHTHFRYLVQ